MKTDLVVWGTAETIDIDLLDELIGKLVDEDVISLDAGEIIRDLLSLCTSTHIESYILPGYLVDKPKMIEYAQDHVKRMIGTSISNAVPIQFDNHPRTDV